MSTSSDLPPDIVKPVLNAANEQSGQEFSVPLRDALNAVGTHPDRLEIRLVIASHLPELTSPIGAGYLAVWLGASVEGGLAPEPTIPPILNALMKWSKSIRTTPGEPNVPISDTEKESLFGIDLLCQALVAHLARSPAQRSQIANNKDVILELERIESLTVGPIWVLEALRRTSGSLIVLSLLHKTGVRVAYENISNCFHLFTLLQQELTSELQIARRTSPTIPEEHEQAALPQYPQEDTARWHYGRGDVPEANFAGSIWGEMSPNTIPEIDGQQVLLLWPMILGARSWDASFFGPTLMASVPVVSVVEQLSDDQVEKWWKRLKLPTLPAKPWWKFW